jgi:hypothetical protein
MDDPEFHHPLVPAAGPASEKARRIHGGVAQCLLARD